MSEWKGFDESQIERALSFADMVKTREDCHHINAYDSLKRLAIEVRNLRAQATPSALTDLEKGAVNNLTDYQVQCDDDGTNVIVSREALDVLLSAVRRLAALPQDAAEKPAQERK